MKTSPLEVAWRARQPNQTRKSFAPSTTLGASYDGNGSNRDRRSPTSVVVAGDSCGTTVARRLGANTGMSSTSGLLSLVAGRPAGEGSAPPRVQKFGSVMLILGCLAVMSGGCAFKAPPGRASADMSAMVVDRQPYRIRVGDALDVRFYKTPELNIEKVPVRNDGKISLDLVGDVQAAGLGTDQLSDN